MTMMRFFNMSHTSSFRLPVGVLLLLLLVSTLPTHAETTGGVVLHWKAPGDDGHFGTATGYDIRYQSQALGPLDTKVEWQAATSIRMAPVPSPAGSIDTAWVLGLTPGIAYYFALRAYDEAGNYSALSNSRLIVAVEMSCCFGRVGDVNGLEGDEPTIADVAMLIENVFRNRPVLCAAEADINQSGGANPQQGSNGDITIGDIALLIDYLFQSHRPLPHCF
jgi:hypothetical protein